MFGGGTALGSGHVNDAMLPPRLFRAEDKAVRRKGVGSRRGYEARVVLQEAGRERDAVGGVEHGRNTRPTLRPRSSLFEWP